MELREFRKDLRLSARRMAIALGVGPATLARWEGLAEVGLLERYAIAAWAAGLPPLGERAALPMPEDGRAGVVMTRARLVQLAEARARKGKR